jgi:molybdopterin synthase catalytic subunit
VKISVRLFATLRQNAGWTEKAWELPEGATVADLEAALDGAMPHLGLQGRVHYAAVNEEYVKVDVRLKEGDRVGFFPPVSGGAEMKQFAIVEHPLLLDDAARRVSRPDCGAIATFAGVVRGSTDTQSGTIQTDFLAYEAYAEMAEKVMAQIGDEIRERWSKVQEVCILHRVGRLEIGEPSVVIAVSTPHRGDGCFDACQYAIERLKQVVPIWKQENGRDGAVWIEGPSQPDAL